MRRAKKKAVKQAGTEVPGSQSATVNGASESDTPATNGDKTHSAPEEQKIGAAATTADNSAEIKYEDFGDDDDPLLSEYKDVFAKFKEGDITDSAQQDTEKPQVFYDDDNDDIPDEEEEQEVKLSKKKRKAMTKLTVAELKSLVRRPELVEWTDTSAPDPRLLISIKGGRNVVPVPGHWSL